MSMKARTMIKALAFAGCLLAGLAAEPALAQGDQDRAREEMLEGRILSYGEIVRRARRVVDGRVIGQDLQDTGRGLIYRLKIQQPDGRVAVVTLDASTGEVLSVRGGR